MKYAWFLVFFVVGMFIFRPHYFGLFADNYNPHTIIVENHYPVPPRFDPALRERMKDQRCLAHAMFFEVRKNNPKEMAMIGNVVENRVKSPKYPHEICDVVGKPDQFPWATFGTGDATLDYLIQRNEKEKESWETALVMSKEIQDGKIKDLTNGAIAFHANTMKKPKSSYWNSLKKTVKSTLHTFYAPKQAL